MAGKAVAREEVFSLRETIARMEGKTVALDNPCFSTEKQASHAPSGATGASLPLGLDMLDTILDGGLPRAGMAEIRTAEMRNAGAATGLALAFCAFLVRHEASGPVPREAVLWISERGVAREAGEPFAEGLRDYGIDPGRLVYALPRRIDEALWLAEAALKSRAFRAVILELGGNPARFGLSESRRLSLRARHTGSLLLLLRQGGVEEAGSTIFRLEARAASAGLYRLADGTALRGTIGAPAFSLTIEKSPKPASPSQSDAILIEWNAHERLFVHALERVPSSPFQPRRTGAAHPVAGFPEAADRPDRAAAMGAVLGFSRAS